MIGFRRSQTLALRYYRPLLGLVALAGILYLLDFRIVAQTIFSASLYWLLGALVLALAANLVCAARWRYLIWLLGTSMPYVDVANRYFQGLSANTVLPGGIVGGDILRSTLVAKEMGSRKNAVLSVGLDRVSGFWGLVVLGTIGSACLLYGEDSNVLSKTANQAYFATLLAASIFPIFFLGFVIIRQSFRALPYSIAAQLLTVGAFGMCWLSIGQPISISLLVALSVIVFLGSAVPANFGGFGSREVACVAVFGYAGLPSAASFSASVLFGLLGTAQGAFYLMLFIRRKDKG